MSDLLDLLEYQIFVLLSFISMVVLRTICRNVMLRNERPSHKLLLFNYIIIWLITFARNQNLLLMTSMIMSVSPLFNLFYFTRVINLKAHKSTIVFKRTYRINSFQYLFNFLINQFIFYYLRDFFFQILKWSLAICSM